MKENGTRKHFGVATGSVFYGINEAEARPNIAVVRLDTEEKFVLHGFPRGAPDFTGGPSVAVSPDAETVLFVQRDYLRSNLMLVEGLEQRTKPRRQPTEEAAISQLSAIETVLSAKRN